MDAVPFVDHRLEQRRLARAVRSDERDMLAALQRERHVAQQCAVADRQRQAVGLDDRASAARRLQELEPERAVSPRQQRDLLRRLLAFLLQPADVRQLRLRLGRLLLLRAEPLDEALEANDVSLDALDL